MEEKKKYFFLNSLLSISEFIIGNHEIIAQTQSLDYAGIELANVGLSLCEQHFNSWMNFNKQVNEQV